MGKETVNHRNRSNRIALNGARIKSHINGHHDVDRESQEAKDLLIGPFKNKFEEFGDQGKASKLFSYVQYARLIQGRKLAKCWRRAPTTDGSLAPTIAYWLLPAELLEFTHLPPTVGFPYHCRFLNHGFNEYFKSLNYRLARVIMVLRPLFPQGSNYQSRKEL
ncbi:hypothetical protein M9H77_03770 [Catharanthus roseus]|uniref:Uncharacterized protein n=1 Tax=Catharanthus roseus TaxID=4058 RepID=A0ACC0CCG7_CATRO|nr:hypothetical protein M9H77_03770 [Catharanthus roseus]